MKGYRVVPLTFEGDIPDEIGEIHHFTNSLERAEWWAERLWQEDVQFVPHAFDYARNGYTIMEVIAKGVTPDRFCPGKDWKGIIVYANSIKVVSYIKPTTWWQRFLEKVILP